MKFESEEELMAWVTKSSHLWLFLDYDGPLANLAFTPGQIQPDPKLIGLLFELSDDPNIRVTIVNGQSLEHIRNLFPVSGIFLAGAYGIELLTPTGDVIQRLNYENVRSFLEWIKLQWNLIIDRQNGYYVEDEGWTLALRAHLENEQASEEVITEARRVIREAPVPGDFRILSSGKILKIAPLLASKTQLVQYLLSQYPSSKSCILYIGYDGKDGDNVAMVHEAQVVAVKLIQHSQPLHLADADFFFKSPLDTLTWLERLI